MSNSLNSLSSRPLPKDLKELLPNPQLPWMVNSDLFKRLQQAESGGKPFKCVPLNQSDPELAFVLRYFFHCKPAGLGIAKISYIHNPTLIQGFEAELRNLEIRADDFPPKWHEEEPVALRAQAIERWKDITHEFSPLRDSSSESLYSKVKVLPLWHGSSGDKTFSIAKMGFTYFGKQHFYHEKARSGGIRSTDPGYYGSGIYFTNSPSYATVYSPEHLILSWVCMNEPYPVVSDIPNPSLENKCSDMTFLEGRGAYQTYNAHYIPVSPLTPNSPDYFPCYYNQAPLCDEIVVFQRPQTLPCFLIELTKDGPETLFFSDLSLTQDDFDALAHFDAFFKNEVSAANSSHIQNLQYSVQAAFRDFFERAFLQSAFKTLGPAPCDYDIRLLDNLVDDNMVLCSSCKWLILIEDERYHLYFLHLILLIEKKMSKLRIKTDLSFPLLTSLSDQDSDNNNAPIGLDPIYTPEKLAKDHSSQLSHTLHSFILLACTTSTLFKSYEQHFKSCLLISDSKGNRPLHDHDKKMLIRALFSMTTSTAPVKGLKVRIKTSFSAPSRYLKPHIVEQILNEEGYIQKQYANSLHQVARGQEGLFDLHFKQNPSQPMMEVFIHELLGCIMEKATPTSLLVRFDVEEKKVSYPVLVSETIVGDVLSHSTTVDKDHLSLLLLCTFLTLPGDGRFSNYIKDLFGRIYCVDNDISFVEPIIKGVFGIEIQFKSYLCCQYPYFELTKQAIETFIKLPFEQILHERLHEAIKIEKSYVSLFKEEEIDAYYQNKEQGFTPYLLLREGTIMRLCLQFFALRKFLDERLKSGKKVEALDLLSTCISLRSASVVEVKSKLYNAYKQACLKTADFKERLNLAISSKQEKSMTTPQAMQASLGKIPTQEEINKQKRYSPEKALQELFAFELNYNEGIHILKKENFFTVKIDFSKMTIDEKPDVDRQQFVLKGLQEHINQSGIYLKEITLTHCAVLNTQELLPFLQQSLIYLNLSYCPQLISNDVLQIEERCPHLEELYLTGCNRLYNLYRGNFINRKPLIFKSLKVLHIAACNLETLSFLSPLLVELNANGNEKLEIKTLDQLPFTLRLELSGCKNYESPRDIFNIFRRKAGFEDAALLDEWKKIDFEGTFLKLCQNDTSLKHLMMKEKKIGDIGVQALAKALERNKILTSLSLGKIKETGAQALAKALKVNSTLDSIDFEGSITLCSYFLQLCRNLPDLTSVNLNHKNIVDAELKILTKALEINTMLTSLDLTDNKIADEGVEALAKSLEINSTLQSLKLSKNHITKQGAQALARGLEINKTLTSLDLTGNKIGDVGVELIAKALRYNPSLTCLKLEGKIGVAGLQNLAHALEQNKVLTSFELNNGGMSYSGAQVFAKALKCNSTFIYLSLSGNNIADAGAQVFAKALEQHESLTSLNLRDNNIRDLGVVALAEALKHNKVLTSLNLGGNNIGDKGALALAEALKHNTNLKSLVLNMNNIGKIGIEALAEALRNNSTLTSLQFDEFEILGNYFLKLCQNDSRLTSLVLNKKNLGNLGLLFVIEAFKHNTILTSLCLENCNVKGDELQAFAKIVASHPALTHVDLADNNIDYVGAEILAKTLEHNTKLTHLILSNNNIGDRGAEILARAFERHKALTNVNLANNNIGHIGAQAFAKSLNQNSSLIFLSLKGNKIGDIGAQAFAKTLELNKTLTSLDFGNIDLGDVAIQALAKALERNKTLKSLVLRINNIKEAGIEALAKALKSNPALTNLEFDGFEALGVDLLKLSRELIREDSCLIPLTFNNRNLGDLGLQILAKVLELNTKVTSLDLENNNISDNGIQALAKALDRNLILKSLNLKNNRIGDRGAQILAKAIESSFSGLKALGSFLKFSASNSHLTTLNLSKNNVTDLGAEAFGQALEDNKILTTLDLSYNTIGDKGAQALAKAFKQNSTLTSLNLSHNKITDAGAEAFARDLEHNTSLTSLGLKSNSIFKQNEKLFLIESNSEDDDLLKTRDKALFGKDRGPTSQDLRLNNYSQQNAELFALGSRFEGKENLNSIEALLGNDPALISVNLTGSTIEDADVETIAEALKNNKHVRSLNLRNYKLSHVGAKALAKALIKNSTINSLDLRDNCIGYSGLQSLAEALRHNKFLKFLDLRFCLIGPEGPLTLIKAIEHNRSLQSLSLSPNNMEDQEFYAFANALTYNSTLTSLCLQSYDLGEKESLIDMYQDIVRATFEQHSMIDKIERNIEESIYSSDRTKQKDTRSKGQKVSKFSKSREKSIVTTRGEAIAEVIKFNSTLISLNLSTIDIGNKGAVAIAKALEYNSTLLHLNLMFCNIEEEGKRAFAEALEHNTTLVSLSLDYKEKEGKYWNDIENALKRNSDQKRNLNSNINF